MAWLAAIVLAAVTLVVVPSGLGVRSLPSLALLLGFAAIVGIGALRLHPGLLIAAVPALIGLPDVFYFSPAELLIFAITPLVIVQGLRSRAEWLTRLDEIEVANAILIVWAITTVFWAHDMLRYGLGLRRMIIGFVAFWISFRMARFTSRRLFEIGVILSAVSLTVATLYQSASAGITGARALMMRTVATDLGWGCANYIAALLLVVAPLIIEFATHSRDRLLRIGAWMTFPLIVVVQGIISARAPLTLLVVGMLAQVGLGRGRRRWLVLGIAILGVIGLALGPWSGGILERFTSPREMASGTIRIWYVRESWRRTVDFFPWGLGVNQGLTWPDHLFGVDPHNYWLVLSSELGVIGVVAWATVMFMLWRRLGVMTRTAGWEGRARALQIALCISLVHGLVEPNFQGQHYQLLFFWVIGGYLGHFASRHDP